MIKLIVNLADGLMPFNLIFKFSYIFLKFLLKYVENRYMIVYDNFDMKFAGK